MLTLGDSPKKFPIPRKLPPTKTTAALMKSALPTGASLLLVTFLLVPATATLAAVNSYTNGAASNSWAVPGNWSLGTVPAASDALSLDHSVLGVVGNSFLNASITADTLSIDAGADNFSISGTTDGGTARVLTLGNTAANALGNSNLIDLSPTTTGTISIGTRGGSGLITIPLPAAAKLNVSHADANLIVGTTTSITGTNGLEKKGSGTLSLTGTNTFSGDVTLSGGTIVSSNLLALGRSPNATTYKNFFISNNATFRTTIDFNDNTPATATQTAMVFNIAPTGATLSVDAVRTLTIDDGAGAGVALANSQLVGSGTLTKTGLGTLSLGNGTSNFNTFTGPIVVNQGRVLVGSGTFQLGDDLAGTTVNSGAALDIRTANLGLEALTISGMGINGGGALVSSSGPATVGGPVTMLASSSLGGTGAITISGVISGAFDLTKVGSGTVTLNKGELFSGTTTINEGAITLNTTTGKLDFTTALSITGNGTLNNGDATAGNGIPNRINPTIPLTLGGANGGGNFITVRGSTTAGSQTFASLTIGTGGVSSINTSGTTGGVPTLTISGATPYTRAIGGIVNVTTTNQPVAFTSAPSGAGNVSGAGANAILVGGILSSNDFIRAASGNLAAAAYTATTWATGINTQAAASAVVPADSVTQSLNFSAGASVLTLSGTNTIESGGILVKTAATSGAITGGNLQASPGADFWIFLNGKPLTIGSSIVDNGTTSLTLGGSNTLTLTGSNTYAGRTQIGNGSTLTLTNTSATNSTVVGPITIGGHGVSTLTLGAAEQIADSSIITFNSGIASGTSAFFNLNGFNETIAGIQTTATPFGTSSVVQNNHATNPAVLTVSGGGSYVFDGIVRNGAAGTLGLTVSGAGTNLTLSNTANVALNNYTGATNIGAGASLTLNDINGGGFGSFASAITNDGQLTLNNGGNANRTIAQPISGSGNLTSNAGLTTITLSGIVSHTGSTVLGSGTTILSNATGSTLSGAISGNGALSQTGAGAVVLTNAANSYTGATTITTGVMEFRNHSLPTDSIVTVGAAGTLKISDDGAGSNGAVNYGNTVFITSTTGTVAVGNNGGASTGNTVAFGALNTPATAAANTTAFTGANGYNVSFTNMALSSTTGATSILNPTTTNVTILGSVTNQMTGFATTNFDTITLDGTSSANQILGSISDATGGSFVPLLGGYTRVIKQNTSTWTLSGAANTYTGVTQVLGGTLKAGANELVPAANVQGLNVTATGAGMVATMDLAGFNQTLNTASGTGTAVNFGGSTATSRPEMIGAGSTLTVNGNIVYTATNNPLGATMSVTNLNLGGATRTFNVGLSTSAGTVASPDLTVSSNISNGGINKTGTGVLLLSGNNTYAGGTTITAGTIVLGSANSIPEGSTVNIAAGATLNLGGFTKNITITGPGAVVNGSILTSPSTTLLKNGPGTLSLGVTMNAGIGVAISINQGLLGTISNPATLSTVALNYAAVGSPSVIFDPTSTVIFGGTPETLIGGGGLTLIGRDTASNSQTLVSTTVNGGASAVTLTAGATGTVVANLGTLTRTLAGTLDITLPAGVQSVTNGVTVSNPGPAGTLVTSNNTAFASANGKEWAAYSTDVAGNIVTASTAGAGGTSIYTTASSAATFTGDADVTATFTANADSTINSLRMNTGGLTLTLSGTNTIATGGILFGTDPTVLSTITGGSIVPGTGKELVVFNNKPSLANGIGSVLADGLSGPTSVTYRGSNAGTTGGLVDIKANNTYTGPTFITSGRVGPQSTLVSTPFGVGADAIVYVNGNTDGQFFTNQNSIIANPFVVLGTGFNEAASRRGVIRLDSTATVTPRLSGSITMLGDSSIANNAAAGTGYGMIVGNIGTSVAAGGTSFVLTKVFTGAIRLTGTNSQSATNINGGVLSIAADEALGVSTSPVTFTGGSTLQFFQNFTLPATRGIVVNTGVTGAFDTGLAPANSVTTIAGVISGPGAINKSYATQGTATNPLVLAGVNTFTGNVTATSGWLVATNSSSFGVGTKNVMAATNLSSDSIHLDPGAGNVIDFPATMSFITSNDTFAGANDGTIVNDSGDNIIRGNLTITSGGGGTILASKAGSITFAGNLTPNQASRTIKLRGDGIGTISGIIANGTTVDLPILRDLGTGAWTLSGANTYTGLTTVSGGTLKVGNASALGGVGLKLPATDNSTAVTGTGSVDLNGLSNLNETLKISGNGNGAAGALVNSGAAASIGGSVTGLTGTLTSATPTTVVFTGGGGTGAAATISYGVTAATFTITSGTQTYSVAPTVAITGGGGAGATATAVLTGGLVTGVTITAPGTGFTTAPTIAFSAGTVLVAGTAPTGVGNATNFTAVLIGITNGGIGYTSAPTVSLANSEPSSLTANVSGLVLAGDSSIGGTGNITINSSVAESVAGRSLTKLGSNTVVLNAANTYTGNTVVSAGSLLVNGSTTSGATTVAAGATLGGAGSVSGLITVNATGVLAPGNGTAPGILTANNVTLNGKLLTEIDGASVDRLNATGTLDITNATFDFSVLGGGATQSVYIIASYGNLTGTAAATVLNLPSGYALNYNYQGNKQIALTPSSAYDQWMDGFPSLTGGDRDKTADPDGDGSNNLLEFALGSAPNSASATPTITPSLDGTDPLVITTLVRTGANFTGSPSAATLDGITYTVEGSLELNNWTAGVETTTVPGTPPAAPSGYQWAAFRITTPFAPGQPKGFMRVKVVTVP